MCPKQKAKVAIITSGEHAYNILLMVTAERRAHDMSELTDEQIARQDYVDNAIYELVNELVPEKYRHLLPCEVTDSGGGERGVPWNQEWIADLRDLIHDIILTSLPIYETSDVDTFEMEFYPFIAEDAEDSDE